MYTANSCMLHDLVSHDLALVNNDIMRCLALFNCRCYDEKMNRIRWRLATCKFELTCSSTNFSAGVEFTTTGTSVVEMTESAVASVWETFLEPFDGNRVVSVF